MDIIQLTGSNLEQQHICCAIADKKCLPGYEAKKQWLNKQFKDGYVFKKLDVRGKVFIEYVPAEKAWAPIKAPGYMLVNCFWVSGRYKGQGHGKALYQECIKDSKDKNGIVVIVGSSKQPFMSEKKFFIKQGFELCDTAEPYFELWYKPFKKDAPIPQFKACAKHGISDQKTGIMVYYTHACPFTDYYANTEMSNIAKKRDLKVKIIQIKNRRQAQNHFVPYTNHSVFYQGKFITQHLLNDKYFDRFIH